MDLEEILEILQIVKDRLVGCPGMDRESAYNCRGAFEDRCSSCLMELALIALRNPTVRAKENR